jgi:hypothetical protein
MNGGWRLVATGEEASDAMQQNFILFMNETYTNVIVFAGWNQHVQSLLAKLKVLSTAPNPFLPAR